MTRSRPDPVTDRARVAHGPAAVERALEREARAEMERVRADPTRLCLPLLLVVPSRSLRLHVGQKLIEWGGSACAGFRVVTSFGLARELCAASGTSVPRGSRLFEPMVEEALAGAGELGTDLLGFEDGPLVAAATLADLFDAGFEAGHSKRLTAALDTADPPRTSSARERARARQLVDVAAKVALASTQAGVGRASAMLRCARDALTADRTLLRARGVWIHGFSDATGALAGLLGALSHDPSALVFWDACAAGPFGRELRQRLDVEVDGAEHAAPAACTLARASRVDAEVRAVADRIRALLDAGAEPERIGIVAREIAPYRVALRRHLGRLSIPFSGQEASGPDGPAQRAAKALAACLAEGALVAVDRWYDARDDATFADRRARPYELRIAARALGLSTLADFAGLDVDKELGGRDWLSLPLRGITTGETRDPDDDPDEIEDDAGDENENDDGGSAAGERSSSARPGHGNERRTVGSDDLRAEVEMARAAVGLFADIPQSAPAAAGLERVEAFVASNLGWTSATPARRIWDAALEALRADLPPELPLNASALLPILEREIEAQAVRPLGGAGGGVACLSVVEARARTFDTLFVLGLVRGRFPRNVREDPLLPDALREAWNGVLPHLPRKSVGRDEERVLFDQLVRSAPAVHLSWLTLDEDGKALLPSSLLERVADPAAIAAAPLVRDPIAPDPTDRPAVARPAHEHATLAALRGRIDGLEQVLPVAIEETRALCGLGTSTGDAAAARIAILREHEPARAELGTLGPYFGLIGRLRTENDLRAGDLHVTQLESIASCGWRAFLTRVLRVEPALDPLATLPALDARLVGDVVHAVLQTVVGGMKESTDWPDAGRVSAILREAAHDHLRERGIFVHGFEALVAARAQPMLDAARAIDAAEKGTIRRAKSEVEGDIELSEGPLGLRRLGFRADRVDVLDAGSRGTDYKTGAPLNKGKKDDTRRNAHLRSIARGKSLQSTVYARGLGPGGAGRYVYLAEGLDADKRVFEIGAADREAGPLFDDAVDTILGALDTGVLFPRLLAENTHQTNRLCASCEMAQACLRGDSGANRRLAQIVAEMPGDADSIAHEEPVLAAATSLWNLALKQIAKPAAIESAAPAPAPRTGKKRGREGT